MKLYQFMESTLIILLAILFILLLWELIISLRSFLYWRVNCWFCNTNIWIKYINRNCWTCQTCNQYNGFTKDGDYNKELCEGLKTSKALNSFKLFLRSPSKNGLCKMCNINQQLKVTQLANFVPMNEEKYDEEIDSYRTHLEKAYKLCSPCERILQKKLYKEKVFFLDSKILETRASDKNDRKIQKQNETIKNLINTVLIAIMLAVLVVVECQGNTLTHLKNLSNTIYIILKQIIWNPVERIFQIVKMTPLFIFPSLEDIDIYNIDTGIFTSFIGFNNLMQKALGGVAYFIQITKNIWNIIKAQCAIDFLWTARDRQKWKLLEEAYVSRGHADS
nr:transmembrane protein 201-like [Maniola hyperantus]